jgi:hypothetical protein
MTTNPVPGGPDAVDTLRRSLADLITESQALRQDVHSAEVARKRANQINSAVLVLLAGFVAMVLVIGWQNNKVISQVQATNNTLADCTTPGRACYEEGQKRTAAAVSALTKISIYVSQCGRLYPGESGPEYDRKVERCVAERLAAAVAAPAPSASTSVGG